MGDEARPEDRELSALRELAAEVVRAAGGLPVRRGYRPRLDVGPRGMARSPAQFLAGVGGIVSSIRRQPRRAATFTLAGCGAVAGLALLVRSLLVPGDASLELIAAPPAPLSAALPAPTPPPETLIVEAPARTPAPPPPAPVAVPAPAPAPAAAPAASAQDALRALTGKRPAKGASAKLATATQPAPKVASATQRRAGRRSDAALAGVTRAKAGRHAPARARAETGALDRQAIIAGMQGVDLRVKRCYQRYGEAGVADTGIVVGSRGEVKKVTISGPLARTSSAACVKAAVKTARFQGGPAAFRYPLVLQ